MTVTVKPTIEDYIAWHEYHHAHSPFIKRARVRFIVSPILIWTLLGLAMYRSDRQLVPFVFVGVVSLAWLFVHGEVWKWDVRRRVIKLYSESQNADLFHEYSIDVRPEGIYSESANSSGITKWDAVEGIVSTERHIFIKMSALLAIGIPNRAFPGPVERQHFLDYINQCREQHAGLIPDVNVQINTAIE